MNVQYKQFPFIEFAAKDSKATTELIKCSTRTQVSAIVFFFFYGEQKRVIS